MSKFATVPEHPELSPAMQLCWACLGGRRNWSGTVRGLFGLINRSLTIESLCQVNGDKLVFSEELRFSDGESQSRSWLISENEKGLVLQADEITLLREGRPELDGLVFDYALQFGPAHCAYRDWFLPKADGSVANIGRATWLRIPIMKIELLATPPA